MFIKVTVFASGNTIEFRIARAEATRFKDAIMGLVLNPPTAQAASAAASLGAVGMLRVVPAVVLVRHQRARHRAPVAVPVSVAAPPARRTP